jgi:hypothetical protein
MTAEGTVGAPTCFIVFLVFVLVSLDELFICRNGGDGRVIDLLDKHI